MSKTNDVRRVGKDLIVGMILFGVIVQIVLLFFPDRIYHAIGLWIGVIMGIISSIHMRTVVEEAVYMEDKSAASYVRNRSILRYLLTAVVFGIVLYFDFASILTLLIGIMGLKVSAYLQPVIRRKIG